MTLSNQRRRILTLRRALLATAVTGIAAGGALLLSPLSPAHSQAGAVTPPAAAAPHGQDWPIFEGGSTRTGSADEAVSPPLSLLWRFTAGRQNADPCAPIVVGTSVYYAARGSEETGPGALYCLDTLTGEQRWEYKLTGNALFQTAPSYDNGVIYIGGSDGKLYAISAENGSEITRFSTGRPINSSPIVVGGVLYFGCDNGTLYALNPADGTAVWHHTIRSGKSEQQILGYNAGDAINSAPVVTDDMVYITTDGNAVQAIKLGTGLDRWNVRMPYRIPANGPIFADNTLYVPAGPMLYALQPSSGGRRWGRDFLNDIITTPVHQNGVVYVIVRDDAGNGAKVYAVRASNGKDAWPKPASIPVIPGAAPTISGNTMYIPTAKNLIVAISLDDGHLVWEYHIDPSVDSATATMPTSTQVTAPVAISKNALYAVSDDGSLLAFRTDAPDKTGPDLYHVYPAVSQRVNGDPGLILASYADDPGSGINPTTVKMEIDDKSVVPVFDAYRSLVSYTTKSSGKITDPPLSNGRHSATVSLADWRGNVSTKTWSFIVDSSVPKYTKTTLPSDNKGASGNNNGKGGGFGGPPGFGGGGGRGRKRGAQE